MKKDYTRYKRRKKRNQIISKVLVIVLIIFLLAVINVITNNIFRTKYEKLPALDKQMLEEMGDIFTAFENNGSDIWTDNYRLDKAPVLVSGRNRILPFLSRGVYVFNADLSDKFYAKEIDVPDEIWSGSVYRIAGVYVKAMPLFISKGYDCINIAGNDTVAIKYNKKSFNNPEGANTLDGTLILGGFDVLVAQKSLMPFYDSVESYDYSEESIGLRGVESRIIDEMLKCKDNQEKLDNLICELVVIRDERYARNSVIALEEPLCEMTLGCAQYSRYKLSDVMNRGYSFFDKNNGTEFEEAFCEAISFDNKEKEEYFQHNSFRQSGAAICFTLDKLPLGGAWKSAIENATSDNIVTPYSILKEYCKQYCKNFDEFTVEEVKAKYGYDIYVDLIK